MITTTHNERTDRTGRRTAAWRSGGGVLVAVSAVAVLAAACGGSSGGSSSGAAPAAASSAAASSSGAAASSGAASSAPASAAGSGTMVTVSETEFKLALSKSTFAPGTYTFVAKDDGHVSHALEIEGPGAQDRKTGTLGPGDSASLTVTLRKGTYELFCPIPGHKELGMDTHITVG